MANPQQPELRRSERVPALDPDATEAARSAEPRLGESRPGRPTPPDQAPGHDFGDEPDQPDLDAFAERFGVPSELEELAAARRPGRRRTLAVTAAGSALAAIAGWALLRARRRR